MIPLKVVFAGDEVYGRMLTGLAKGQMGILKRQRELGLKNTSREVSPFPGVLIECFAGATPEHVVVTVTPQGVAAMQVLHEEIERACICNCNFSAGVVIELTGDLDDANLYSVAVCHNKTAYSLYENVLASDFTIYESGEKVIVIPYNLNTFLCCTGGQNATGCNPKKSAEPFESDTWRTTYRIIPWCGLPLPRWIERRVR